MKKCSRCNQEKDLSEFRANKTRKNRLQTWCKVCESEYKKHLYEQDKDKYVAKAQKQRKDKAEWLRELKQTLNCTRCGDSRWYVLDFHHRDKNEKDFCVQEMIHRNFSKKKILLEISKCDVVCANCHREIHYLDR